MAIPKVIGTETEYGISAVGAPDFNPVLSSSILISGYAGALRRIRWDYEQESPLRDARGFEPVQMRESARARHPRQGGGANPRTLARGAPPHAPAGAAGDDLQEQHGRKGQLVR